MYKKTEDRYQLFSCGPDGESSTADDIQLLDYKYRKSASKNNNTEKTKRTIGEKEITKIKEIAESFGIVLNKTERKDIYFDIEGVAETPNSFFDFANHLNEENIKISTQRMSKIDKVKVEFIARCQLKD